MSVKCCYNPYLANRDQQEIAGIKSGTKPKLQCDSKSHQQELLVVVGPSVCIYNIFNPQSCISCIHDITGCKHYYIAYSGQFDSIATGTYVRS